jgi:uncharacterized membrane protein
VQLPDGVMLKGRPVFIAVAAALQNCLMLINTILVERTIERESLWERLSIEDLRVLTPLFPWATSILTGSLPLILERPSFLEAA